MVVFQESEQSRFISNMSNIDIVKYLSIPFEHLGDSWNSCDCYGLAKLFYKTELGVSLPEKEYADDFEKYGFNTMERGLNEYFYKVNSPEKFCIVTFKKLGGKICCHMGIMLDETRFLHIPRNKMPVIDRLTNQIWKRRLYKLYKLRKNVETNSL